MTETTEPNDGDDITDEELENALQAAHELGLKGDDAEPDDDGDE